MPSINVTNFRRNIFEYLGDTIKYNDILRVNTKEGIAVVMSEEEYRSLLETLHLIQYTKTKQDIDDSLNNIDNKDYWVDESEVDFGKI